MEKVNVLKNVYYLRYDEFESKMFPFLSHRLVNPLRKDKESKQ